MLSWVKRTLIGRPLASEEERGQRLPKRLGLPVFASDAISSTAYATEEILHILVPVMGMAALGLLVPISYGVIVLLAAVVISYRQTIYQYANGGGAYIVARDNLGGNASLVAGASLLVDYTLTVAVSVSAGVAAVVSAFPELLPYRVPIALAVVAGMTLANLRGAKESGTLFAVPTYAYILVLGSMLAYGLYRTTVGGLAPLPVEDEALRGFTRGSTGPLMGLAGALLVARAFSSGAVALTGTEAITNGIPAFRAPESRNAARTLVAMALILGGYTLGIALLANQLQPTLHENETILSIMGAAVFGDSTLLYYLLQLTTTGILFLAANTAFADFPRLSSIIAADGYMPRQLATRGDRLVFSNGVVLLALFAMLLLVAFGGVTTALIPLYAVGVFTGFTISQWGMVRHHRRVREPGWRRGQIINAVGALLTGLVLLMVVISKFTTGAWIVVVVVPVIIVLFRVVHDHYQRVRRALRVPERYQPPQWHHTVIVLLSRIHRGSLNALEYARSLAPDHLLALSVVASEDEEMKVRRQWESCHVAGIQLEIVRSQYRELVQPILAYVDNVEQRWDDDIVTVVLPEFVVGSWWEGLLHNQAAFLLKARLRLRPNTVVISVPLHLESLEAELVAGGRPAAREGERTGQAATGAERQNSGRRAGTPR